VITELRVFGSRYNLFLSKRSRLQYQPKCFISNDCWP